MFDGGNFDGVASFVEANPIAADTHAKFRRIDGLESLHVSLAKGNQTASECRMRNAVG